MILSYSMMALSYVVTGVRINPLHSAVCSLLFAVMMIVMIFIGSCCADDKECGEV